MINLKGTFTALVTPFVGDQVDYSSLEKLVKFQLDSGVNGFVVNGTTAESPTLTKEEVKNIFSFIRNLVGAEVPLIVGTGSNSTEQTKIDSLSAEKMGADAILVVVPYYNKPPQRGLYEHFKVVAEAVKIPTILYNVPGRTITSLEAKTIADLTKVQGIQAIKEASGNIPFASEIMKSTSSEFTMLSGDDGTYVEFLGAGGHGVISVATHVIPKQMVQWKKWVEAGQIDKAREDIKKHSRLIDLLFVEANPIPVKKALQLMGIIKSAALRLPLAEHEEKYVQALSDEMKKLELI